ncbi:MAG: hypothetical protein SFV18_03160 [Bryobacteraceae bacterium]|nr:hypothetical protein [Bryobacteraceae bacterium]
MKTVIRLALALALWASIPLLAFPITFWAGAGATGSDPFGNNWSVSTNAAGNTVWGMPGSGLTAQYTGPCCTNFFYIEFLNVPAGVSIDYSLPGLGTIFRSGTGLLTWVQPYNGSTFVGFHSRPEYPCCGLERLEIGDEFFVNVTFNGVYDSVAFNALWGYVPEPGNFVVLLSGLAAIGMLRRSRS